MEQEYSTADLAEESKFMISPFRSYIMHMVSLKTTISSNSALSRRLPRFPVVYPQTMETFFFTKVLKSARSCDFWKQIELDDIDNMKFQELPRQSMINEIVPICKFRLVNPATITAGKGPFRQLEGSTMTKEKF